MKTFFKTALVAAAIATACGTAHAGDTTVATQTYSLEGVSAVTTNQTSGDISYTTKAAYAVGDKVTFTFTAGSVVNAAFPSQLNVDAIAGRAGMALGLLNSNADSVTYRVTSVTQFGSETGNTTLGSTIELGAVTLKAAAVAAGDVTVTVSSETQSGDVLDSASSTGASRTAKLTQVKSQFGALTVSTDFDGVIDVAEDRKALTTANDSVTYSISQIDTTGWIALATVAETNVTLNADLAGFDLTKAIGSVSSANAGTVAYNDTDKKVTVKYSGQVTTDTLTITPATGTKAVVLEAQNFELAGAYTHSTDKVASVGSKTAGAWTLNGAMVNIPYMPYGPNVSQIIYVTNSGSLTGDVAVTAFDDKGNDFDLGVVAQATAGKITKLTGPIYDGLMAAGFTGSKVSITITVNAQDKDITVYNAYNVGGNGRGNVINSQYKGK